MTKGVDLDYYEKRENAAIIGTVMIITVVIILTTMVAWFIYGMSQRM